MASFFSDLFGGKSSIKAARQGAEDQMHMLSNGYNQAEERTNAAYNTASSRLSPYEQTGRNAFDAYADAIGLGGAAGYGRAMEMFRSPFLDAAQASSQRDIDRLFGRYLGQGQTGPGAAAAARASQDRYAGEVDAFRQRLAGAGNTGLNVARTLSGMDVDRGNALANMSIGRYGGLANIRGTQVSNEIQARNQGMNNLMSGLGMLGGTLLSGFAPGYDEATAFGNMGRAFQGGANALMAGFR